MSQYTLVHLAVKNNHLDALQRLLKTGEVAVNRASGSRGQSALFIAAAHGRVDAARMLIEHGSDVNQLSDEGQSPLIVAAAAGQPRMMRLR